MVELLIWTLVIYLLIGGLLVGYSFLSKPAIKPTIAQRIMLGAFWLPWAGVIMIERIRDGKLPKV